MIAAIARTLIRAQKKQLRTIDDLLFLFACVCLVASTILLVRETTPLYLGATLIASLLDEPGLGNEAASSPQNLKDAMRLFQSVRHAYSVLIWATIFAVKFCYLCFFRLLIDRLKGLITYWRVTAGITAVSAGFNLCALFIACPYLSQESCKLSPLSPLS